MVVVCCSWWHLTFCSDLRPQVCSYMLRPLQTARCPACFCKHHRFLWDCQRQRIIDQRLHGFPWKVFAVPASDNEHQAGQLTRECGPMWYVEVLTGKSCILDASFNYYHDITFSGYRPLKSGICDYTIFLSFKQCEFLRPRSCHLEFPACIWLHGHSSVPGCTHVLGRGL